MPDRSAAPSDDSKDPIADLFENLPDPVTQQAKSALPDAPTAAAARAASEGRDSEDAPVPGSRRAAREAAARDTGAQEIVAPAPSSAHTDRVEASPTSTPEAVAWPLASEPGPSASSDAAPSGATLDDLFHREGATPTSTEPRRRSRKKGCLIALIILLVLLGGAVAGGVAVWNVYGDRISEVMGWGEPKDYEEGIATGETLVTISSGDTGSEVSAALYRAGVTKTSDVFYDMLVKENIAKTFYPGVYRLQTKMTAAAALAALDDPANKLENSALIREGLSIAAILPILSESLDIPMADLEAAVADPSVYGVTAPTLEGWLFPALYDTFEAGTPATEVIAAMVERTRESLAAAGVPAGDEQRILTIASIIQREARYEEDFYKVSRVIQNRLGPDNAETGGRLEMDSTVQYGYGQLHQGEASTSEEARNDDNGWNTYMYPGLPVGPIASAGDLAIDAAMHPVDGPWFYFVTVNMDTGETIFTNTYDEHLVYVEQMQQWCSENPDSGC
ncbi:endolytic transglycosylase MltG [Microbacterium keratanolyticum]|uniref:endolytic transglycosylase MltG n=2 Tax=Microbacterium keratanolyticum TaxID=67574 RepID=UPI00366A56A5